MTIRSKAPHSGFITRNTSVETNHWIDRNVNLISTFSHNSVRYVIMHKIWEGSFNPHIQARSSKLYTTEIFLYLLSSHYHLRWLLFILFIFCRIQNNYYDGEVHAQKEESTPKKNYKSFSFSHRDMYADSETILLSSTRKWRKTFRLWRGGMLALIVIHTQVADWSHDCLLLSLSF